MLADCDDWQNEAIFGEVAPVPDNHVLDDVIKGTGIDAYPSHGDLISPPRTQMIDFECLAGFDDKRLFEARKAKMRRQLGVLRKLAVFAVNRKKVARTN